MTMSVVLLVGSVLAGSTAGEESDRQTERTLQADRAISYLKKSCAFGPRPTGSPAMKEQQAWLTGHFERLGGKVRRQEFRLRHPLTGQPVSVVNLIVSWHPERADRILLATHHDTRPFPDQEKNARQRRGLFIGANDGASGVALFCELAHHMKNYRGKFGVDFVLFDAEEFVFNTPRDRYFIGSEHFARSYVNERSGVRYRAGVLVDMIADAELQIYKEKMSVKYAGPLVRDIWKIAKELEIDAFRSRVKHEVRDDHLPLNEIARIPTVDIIDFDYPRPGGRRSYWHTQADTPDKCSGESIVQVGGVLWTWLNRIR